MFVPEHFRRKIKGVWIKWNYQNKLVERNTKVIDSLVHLPSSFNRTIFRYESETYRWKF